MELKRIAILLLCFGNLGFLLSQNNSEFPPQVRVIRSQEKLQIDGKLDEAIWQRTSPTSNFYQIFPTDGVHAEAQTQLFFSFDDKNLYVGIRCYSIGKDFIVPSLKRDYSAGGSDNITLLFDTFYDKTNAFYFGINPLGVRREGLISGGGQDNSGFSGSWDNSWKGEAHIFEDRWEAELAIPFKTLRFKEGSKKWGLLSYRFDQQANERSVWPEMPRNQFITNLAFCGDMIWDEALGKPGKNLTLIPFLAGSMAQDKTEGDGEPQFGITTELF